MTLGFLNSLFAGICWVLVAMLMTRVSRHNYSKSGFYAIGTFLGALFCFLFWLPTHEGFSTIPKLMFFLFLAASFNACCQLIQMTGLKKQNCAMFLSICQLNFVFSFCMMILFFGNKATVFNVIGIVVIACAILASSLCGKNNTDVLMPSLRDVLMGALAICLGGTCTIFVLLAGKVEGAPLSLKTGMMLLCGCLFHIARVLLTWEKIPAKTYKPIFVYGTAWSFLAIGSYAFVFMASKYLEPLGFSGLIHAIAGSTNIFGYWLFSVLVLKTGTTRKQILIMLLLLAGIITFRLG